MGFPFLFKLGISVAVPGVLVMLTGVCAALANAPYHETLFFSGAAIGLSGVAVLFVEILIEVWRD